MHLNSIKPALILLMVLPCTVSGQVTVKEDTVKTKEVVISRNRGVPALPGFKRISVDSTLLRYYTLFPLTETLNENSQLFFKSYGAGALASTSFRGAGASRTQVAWNGVNLNDPMTGQVDFTLLPSGMADAIMISYGAASMETGFGGIGGLINMETKPDFSGNTLVEFTPGMGSFDSYSGMIKVRTGNDHFNSSTKAWITSARNNYQFLNKDASPSPRTERRKNGEAVQRGVLQEISLRNADNITSARIWYQSASRHLPGSTLSEVPDSAEFQFDESFRTQLATEQKLGRNKLFVNGTWMYSRLNYEFPKYFIDSRNESNTTVLKAGLKRDISKTTNIELALSDEMSAIRSVNYSAPASRNTFSATLTGRHLTGKRIGVTLLAREILYNSDPLSPDFSVGAEYRIFRKLDHFLKFNISRNSTIPTMNDLYWSYGGNPDLKNEYSWTNEAGYSLKHSMGENFTLNGELTVFSDHIRNMIMWYPASEYFWTVGNIGSVNITGFESSVAIKTVYGNFKVNLTGGYSLTAAREDNAGSPSVDGKQLIYVPRNRGNATLNVVHRNIYGSWVLNVTGRTFITEDNSGFLKGYTLNSLITGIKLRPWNNLVDVNFRVENVFNVRYEAVAHYPQPGRAYFISALFRFSSVAGEE
jgi:outer membrane receptor protein involved in Fe transport